MKKLDQNKKKLVKQYKKVLKKEFKPANAKKYKQPIFPVLPNPTVADGICFLNESGQIEFFNEQFKKILIPINSKCNEIKLFDYIKCYHEESKKQYKWKDINKLKVNTINKYICILPTLNEQAILASLTVIPIYNSHNKVHFILILHDVNTETHQEFSAMEILNLYSNNDNFKSNNVFSQNLIDKGTGLGSYKVRYDELTGLYSRNHFVNELNELVKLTHLSNIEHACIYMDLDRFRVINDSCGHQAGDFLLKIIARIIKDHLSPKDCLARLGDDEFGILLYQKNMDEAVKFSETLQQRIQDFKFNWESKHYSLSCSMGIVPVNQKNTDASQILSKADTLCFIAKEEGRGRVYIYQEKDQKFEDETAQYNCLSNIYKALDKQLFRLYVQEILPINNKTHDGQCFEVLIRMEDENNNTIYPNHFLPTAERFNLITRLDKWVIQESLKRLSQESKNLQQLSLCCINLSAQSITDNRLVCYIKENLERYGIPPNKICFEITETGVIANLDRAIDFIGQIRTLGCSFSLDDFGSGMSSFAYLKDLPVDFVKISGTFVKDMIKQPVNREVVKAINHVSQILGKKTVAEFVENAHVLQMIKELGVDFAQGYGIGKPKPMQ